MTALTHRPSAPSATVSFAWRAMLKVKHVPEQLADVIAIPVIFTVMFTYLFGGAIAGSSQDYLQFLLPGTLAMTVVLVTMYAGVGVSTDFDRGVADRFRSLAIWRPAPIVGAMIGDVGRYLIASTLVVALGLVLGYRPAGGLTGVALAVALAIVFAHSLSWLWVALGLIVRTPSAVMNLGFVVQFPLTLASNVFADPRTMPGWLRVIVEANPMTHMVTAERGLLSGDGSSGEIALVLAVSAALVAVFAPLTMWLYGRRV